jgi:glutamate/tyrosine decarboxylase-like PLP-dependent enzyme
MTSGGTESILMAVKTARDRARDKCPKIAKPEMILPSSAHPAFEKAAHYFGVTSVHVPVRKDFRADPRATKKAITKNTILMVGSAPAYPHGMVDPIGALAELARQ